MLPRPNIRAIRRATLIGLVVLVGFAYFGREKTHQDVFIGGGNTGTVLVTGGLGFIGSHLVELLLARHHLVLVLDDGSSGHNHNRQAMEYDGNILVVNNLTTIPDIHIDAVVHLAAKISVAESMKNPKKYKINNVDGSIAVMEWTNRRKIKRFVAASSAAVYGNPVSAKSSGPRFHGINESMANGGLSPYATTKFRMEKEMQKRASTDSKSFSATALRFFNVYGPRQDPKSAYSGVISKFMAWGQRHEIIKINGDGQQTRDFVFVKDVAEAILTAINADIPGFSVFNVCTGTEITMDRLAELIAEMFPAKSKKPSAVQHIAERPGDIQRSVCDPTKAREILGFSASVHIKDGLRRTAEWFAQSR